MKISRSQLLYALFALVLLGIAGLSWAQSDTPIIITDGSLTMESRNVPWSRYSGTGDTRRHPETRKSVTGVDLTVNGNTQTIPFSGQQCNVTARYGNTTVTISTDAAGHNLQVATDFAASFHAGATPDLMAHNNASGQLGAITVMKNGAPAFRGTGSGHSQIVIHYR